MYFIVSTLVLYVRMKREVGREGEEEEKENRGR